MLLPGNGGKPAALTEKYLLGPQLKEGFGISFPKAFTHRLLSEEAKMLTVSFHHF